MAATDYKTYAYVRNNDAIHPIRMDVATAAAQPTAAATTGFTSDISAMSSDNKNMLGLHARYVRLARQVTTGANPGTKTGRLVILTAADWNGLSKGSTITVNSIVWTVTGKSPEDAK